MTTYYKIKIIDKNPIFIKKFNCLQFNYKVYYYPKLGIIPLSDLILTESDVFPFSIYLSIESENFHEKFIHFHKGVVTINNGKLEFHIEPISYNLQNYISNKNISNFLIKITSLECIK